MIETRVEHRPWPLTGAVAAAILALLLVPGSLSAQPLPTERGYEAHGTGSQFTDIGGSEFVAEIEWLYSEGITRGCNEGGTQFCPTASVTRAQMASFLVRALDLPAAGTDYFVDDSGSEHEADINSLRQANITTGCGTDDVPGSPTFGQPIYCPSSSVTREQMASFIARALTLPAPTADYFDDDRRRIFHENDINRLAEAQITRGCGVRLYCPTLAVTREQMAAFLYRSLAPQLRWVEGTPPNGFVNSVVEIQEKWLALGSSSGRAAVWSSSDGLTWQPTAPIEPAPVSGDDSRSYSIHSVAETSGGLLAVGSTHIGCCDGAQAASWTSTDGQTWTYHDPTGTPFGDTFHIPAELVRAPAGHLLLHSGILLGAGSTFWISADGLTWEQESLSEADGGGETAMRDLAVGGGMILGVGEVDIFGAGTPGVWSSTDGRAWATLAPPADATGELRGVAYDETRARFVAIGSDTSGAGAAWATSDGTSWQRLALPPTGVALEIDSEGELLAIAVSNGTHPNSEVAVYSSFDGTTWQTFTPQPAVAGGVVLGVGEIGAVLLTDEHTTAGPVRRGWAGTRAN